MEVLREAPGAGSFVSLAEHQSTTPPSFHAGPPVLHYFSDRCRVIVFKNELSNAPALSSLVSEASAPAESVEGELEAPNGASAQTTIEDIDVWVTSEYATRYFAPT